MRSVSLIALLALLALVAPAPAIDTARTALISLCDPAKIATLTSDRAANPRVRKIAYWLEVARQSGRDPQAEMTAVMEAVGWGGTMKGELTAKAMVRNRIIAERLGYLDAEAWSGCAAVHHRRSSAGLMLATNLTSITSSLARSVRSSI